MKARLRRGALLAVLLAAAGCAGGDSGPPGEGGANVIANLKPGERPPASSDEAGLWMRMDRAEADLKTSGRLVRDPELNGYVKNLMCNLAGPYCGDIRTYVVRVPYFNASMSPNGVMQVWTGLLLRVENEAQLAAVLSHEFAHYIRRHSLQRYRSIRQQSTFLVFFSIATLGVGEIARLSLLGSVAAFSRDHEREADEIGQKHIHDAGYDPREAASVWARLIKEKNAGDNESRTLFLATHPSSEERLETLNTNGAKLIKGRAPVRTDNKAFRKVTHGWRGRLLRDDLHLRRYAKSEVLFKTLIEDGQNVGEVYYFLGELYRLRREKDDLDKALEAYRKADSLGGAPTVLHRSLGLVYSRKKDSGKARKAFRRYLALNPKAKDYRMIESMLKAAERE